MNCSAALSVAGRADCEMIWRTYPFADWISMPTGFMTRVSGWPGAARSRADRSQVPTTGGVPPGTCATPTGTCEATSAQTANTTALMRIFLRLPAPAFGLPAFGTEAGSRQPEAVRRRRIHQPIRVVYERGGACMTKQIRGRRSVMSGLGVAAVGVALGSRPLAAQTTGAG